MSQPHSLHGLPFITSFSRCLNIFYYSYHPILYHLDILVVILYHILGAITIFSLILPYAVCHHCVIVSSHHCHSHKGAIGGLALHFTSLLKCHDLSMINSRSNPDRECPIGIQHAASSFCHANFIILIQKIICNCMSHAEEKR